MNRQLSKLTKSIILRLHAGLPLDDWTGTLNFDLPLAALRRRKLIDVFGRLTNEGKILAGEIAVEKALGVVERP